MTSLDERLKDEGYRGWLKTVMCFQFVRDGLVKFAEKRSQALHGNVLYNLQHYGRPAPNILCPDTSFKKCTCGGNCKDVLIELKNHAINNFLELRNSDLSQLPTKHWQNAKLYMNYGQAPNNTDSDQTDISGLLNFLINCKEAADCISDIQKIKTVRETRNTIIHTYDMKVQRAEVMQYSDAMIDLLKDTGNGQECLLHDQQAQKAAQEIGKVQVADFKISKDDEIKVLNERFNELTKQVEELKKTKENVEQTKEKLKEAENSIDALRKIIERDCDLQKEFTDKLTKLESDMKQQLTRIERIEEDVRKLGTRVEKLEGATEEVYSEEDLEKLVQYLKDGYEKEKLQVLLPGFFKIPLCEIFSPVILIKKGLSDKESTKERLSSYKDMFYHGEVQKKQLFLVGEAGAGKSTYSKHLVDVWCNKSETPQFADPKFVRQFQFMFHVSFRFAKPTDSIHDMICDQLFDDENMKSIAINVLRHYPKKCFIITDGLDEWQCPPGKWTGRRGDIPGLPSRKGVEACLILITSRPWRLQALTTELEPKSIFELDGLLTPEKLIKKMLEEMGDSDPKKSCRKFQDEVKRCNMNEIMKTPLLLITVLSIWDKDQSLSPSVCHNYIRIIESIILRAIDEKHWAGDETRLREPLVDNLDTLKTKWEDKSSTLPSCCQKLKSFKTFAGLIISLSHLAFDLLFGESTSDEQKLVFSKQDCKGYLCDEELNVCLGIGILSQSQTSRARRKIDSYSFIHKSFQEFLSALWLAGPDSVDSVVRIKKRIRKEGRLYDFKLLIKFLCGLAPEVGANILIYSYKHCNIYCGFQNFVLDCSVESQHCNNTTHVYPTLPGLILVLRSISMDKFRMLTDILKSPSSGLRCLDIDDLSLDHSSIDLLYQSLSCCVNLECLGLVRISCSDDRHYVSPPVLDLQRHHKLEQLTLWELSVRTVLWPQVTNSCLRELNISECNNISPVLDLQKHHKLEKLTLWWSSVRTVLWPPVTNSCLRWLHIRDLNLTHGCVEELCRTYEQYRQLEMKCCEVNFISCVDHGTYCKDFKALQEHIKSVNLP